MSYRSDIHPSKDKPAWLFKDRCPLTTNKNTLRGIKYYQQLYRATPPWQSEEDRKKIAAIYRERDRRRARGENVVVDHIVPVCSPLVCGLMVPWNLQIVTHKYNETKSNHWWPDHPNETLVLFDIDYEPTQLRLPL